MGVRVMLSANAGPSSGSATVPAGIDCAAGAIQAWFTPA